MNNLINPVQTYYNLFFFGAVFTSFLYSLAFIWWLSYLGSRFMFVLLSVSNLPMVYKRLFTLQCFRPCVLCWVYCGQWSALASCWQAFGHSLWACCPSTPYHRSIDLLLQVPASVSVSAFFVSLPVSLPPCLFPPSAPLSDYLSSFFHFHLSSCCSHQLSLLCLLAFPYQFICLPDSPSTVSPVFCLNLISCLLTFVPTITLIHVSICLSVSLSQFDLLIIFPPVSHIYLPTCLS